MHECPDCGQACSCDIEDTWNEAAADDCVHDCDGYDDEDGEWAEDEEGRPFDPPPVDPADTLI